MLLSNLPALGCCFVVFTFLASYCFAGISSNLKNPSFSLVSRILPEDFSVPI